jgi:flagellar biosynthesis/type III secretory pathway chaperone
MSTERILKTLRVLERLYARLTRVAADKRTALIEFNVPAMTGIVEREEELIIRLRRVEQVREDELAQWLPTVDSPTLTDLLQQFPDAELEAIRDRLRVLACELARVNRLNAELCRQGLDHLEGFIDLITRGSAESSTYGRNGGARRYSPQALLNRSM